MVKIMREILRAGFVLAIFYQPAFADVGPKIPFGEADCENLDAPMPDYYRYPVSDEINEDFGSTKGRPHPHGGTDFLSPDNTPVYPIGDGTVVLVGKAGGDVDESYTLGCWIAIRNAANVFTFYGHLDCDKINVKSGDIVTRTTILAESDHSGYYNNARVRPHLHVEFWYNCPPKLGATCWKDWVGPPHPDGYNGRPKDLRCLFDYPPPKPPPPLGPSEYTLVAWTPHDPNAMLGPEGYVTPGQLMTYTIMFENEGTGTAFDVYITDIFDTNLDDSELIVKDFYLVDWATNTETSATLPYNYDRNSRKLTVFAGTFDSRKGGKFTVELRLKPDVPQGTVIKNFALV
ncbi:MAG: M23 family metallopeptidase [Elusimicrobia bacterium]|nr:M23 family metallopeptidase [Elusimicrobiota bacterium]